MKKLLFLCLALGLVLGGCAGAKKGAITPIQKLDAPDWVKKGSGAFKSEKGNMFYGVGSATDINNFSLLSTTADNRARSELSKVLETFSSSLMKDYMAATVAADPSAVAEEQHVEQAIKTVSSTTLSGAEIVDHWQNPETGEMFSLASIDMESFRGALEASKELNEKTKDHIRQNSDRLHQELERQVEKLR